MTTTLLPLSGLRILTLAHLYPGPYATMMLADLGADVIIVENPQGGDRTRRFAGHFEALNRNKRSIALDLKDPEARSAFLQAVATSDVVLEGFRPGVMERLGLTPAVLRSYQPNLIYVSISAYGQDGPMRSNGAHDLSLQAAAGMIAVPAGAEATTELPAFALSDIASAHTAALGIVCALLQRQRQGKASTVDVSMLDSAVSWMTPYLVPALNALMPARLPPTDPGYGIFASGDGVQFTLSLSGEDHLWSALCTTLGLESLASLDETARIAQRGPVQTQLRAAIAAHPALWLYARFDHDKIPYGPVHTLHDVPHDPQIAARGMVIEYRDGSNEQPMQYIRQALVFEGQQTTIRSRAPQLGEHTADVLREAGLSEEQLSRLQQRNAAAG